MKKLLYLLAFLSFIETFAQPPKECTNPPVGYEIGGSFNTIQFVCIDEVNQGIVRPSAIQNADLSTVQYNFNYKGGAITVNPTTVKDTTYTKEGIYYILMTSLDEYKNKQLTCAVTEVIKTEIPEFDVISCEKNNFTVRIKDTEINRKHSGYRIMWEDSEKIEYYESKTLPFTFSHQYSTNLQRTNPKIVGVYKRVGFEICNSQAHFFNVSSSLVPRINAIETDGQSNSFKFQHSNFIEKNYDILAQEKGVTDWKFVGKTQKNQTTISNLDVKKEYFFKLSLKQEECSKAIESDTIANIALSFQGNTFRWATRATELQKNISYELQVGKKNFSFDILDTTANNFFDMSIDRWVKYVNRDFRISLKMKNNTIWSNIVSLPPLGNENDENESIRVFPLPFNENINLSSSIRIDKIEVINTRGQKVLTKSVENNQVFLNELSPGKYLLKLYNQNNQPISTKTVIKL